MTSYKQCTRCVMDNRSDQTITFDSQGVCNYCTSALEQLEKYYFPNEKGEQQLQAMLEKIKGTEKNSKYDCIMGLSGGLDSSYLAYLGYTWGLRVLAVHIDDGYDTEISTANLKRIIEKTGFDYQTITPDALQFNALTKAYMVAGVPNIATPQDNILFAFLYDCMKKDGIRYFLTGGNLALESILQRGNTHTALDVVNLKDINKRFGEQPIDKLKFLSTFQAAVDEKILGVKTLRPLNFVDYNRSRALEELNRFCGFEYYGRKHLENYLTAFIQLYWFPTKFNVDKRTSHLSSMIASGQMTREEALEELSEPLCSPEQMKHYIDIVKTGLGITDEEFDAIVAAPPHQHTDYRTEDSTLPIRFLKFERKLRHR